MIKKLFIACIIGLGAGTVMALYEFRGPLKNIRTQDWTASRLAYITAANDVNSVLDLTAWIGGTPNQVYVVDDGDGSVTLNLPQDINTVSWPTFADINITSLDPNSLVVSDSSDTLQSLATGADGYILEANSVAPYGMSWIDPNSGILSGIYLLKDGSNADTTIDIQDEKLQNVSHLGVGAAATNVEGIFISENPLNTTSYYNSLYAYINKTQGATDWADNISLIVGEMYLDQTGGEIGHVFGADYDLGIIDGNVGDSSNSRDVYVFDQFVRIGGGGGTSIVWGDVYGWNSLIQVAGGGTVKGDEYGIYNDVTTAAADEVEGNMYGIYNRTIDGGGDVNNVVYNLYLNTSTGTDYCIFQSGTAPSYFGGDVNTPSLSSGDDSNYVDISGTGFVTLYGDAQVWVGINLEPGAVRLPGANPPAEDNIDNFLLDRFDRATEESVYYHWEVPEDFAIGSSSVQGFFEFIVENPPVTPNGDEAVVMGFEWKNIGEGEVFDFSAGTSSGTVTETIAEDETAYIIHRTDLGTITTTGWEVHDTILFRFYRDATNVNDTYDNEGVPADNDAWVFNYHLQYLRGSLGEAQ